MRALRAGGKAVLFALLASLLVVVPPPPEQAAAQGDVERPNIVYIMTDDQDLALMEYMPQTQALLVDQGVSFTNGLVDLPLCCPARATTLLGQGARKHGIYANQAPLGGYVPFVPLENETVAVWMDRAGYDTAFFGKYVNGYPLSTPSLRDALHIPPGWDRWFGLWTDEQEAFDYSVNDDGVIRSGLGYNTDVMAAAAVDFIDNSDDDPFMMMVFDTAPHTPMVPAPRHADMYPDLVAPRPPNFDEADMSDKTYYADLPPVAQARKDAYDREFRLRVLEMQAVDDMVADVVASLDAAGKLDNTYIVFTSDNGYLLGNHRLRGKVFPYEEAINVPLIVRGPGITPGTTSDELVGNIDFAPTFTALAGGEVTIDVDGANFMGLVSDRYPTPAWRDTFRVNAAFFDGARGKDDIMIHFATGGREYYDLIADPYQLENSYDSMDPVRKAELESAIAAFTAENDPPQVDAGSDQVITTLTTTLSGSAIDDGLPYATDVYTHPPVFEPFDIGWTQVSGPEGVVFADPTNPSTSVTFPSVGTYQLALHGDDSTGPVTDLVSVFVRPVDVSIGFVAGRTSLPGPDADARSLMLDAGFDVTVIDDDTDLSGIDLAAFDLLAISSSVAPNKVGDVFKDAPLPILTWENFLFEDLALASENITGVTETRITIRDDSHPLAADLINSPKVYSTANALSYGTVGDEAVSIASVQGEEGQTVLAAYSAGDLLTDDTPAAAARVLFFTDYRGPQRLTTAGEELFTTALQWMAAQAEGAPAEPENEAPVVDAGPDVSLELPALAAVLAGSATDDGFPPGSVLTTEWLQVGGPAGVTFNDATASSTTATLPGEGTFTLQLSATDGELTTIDTTVVTVRPNTQNAVMVAGTTQPPSGDRDVLDLMIAAGFEVTVIDDDANLQNLDTSSLDLIVITSSVVPTKVGDVFKDTPVPVLTWENFLFEDLGLADENLSSATHTKIAIAEPSHPIAAGNTGTVTVYTEPNRLSWGTPAADASVIAHVPGRPDEPVIIAYEAGDTLIDGTTAPAARVVVFPDYNGARRLNTAGQAIIAAALAHAEQNDIAPDPVNAGPAVDAGADVTIDLPVVNVALVGSASDDGLPTGSVLTMQWSQLAGPSGVTFTNTGDPTTTATMPAAGTFVLQLSATDGEATTVDTVTVTVVEPGNVAPVVDAGVDVTIDLPVADVALAGVVSDDGFPTGSTLSVGWSQVSGPLGVTFLDATAASTTATMPSAGTFTLQLAATDGASTTVDTVTITVRATGHEMNALFVSRITDLPLSDRVISDLLVDAGVQVTVVDDDSDLSSIDTTGVDLILVSSSVGASKVGSVFKDTPVPLITWETFLLSDLGLATEQLTSAVHTQIEIVDSLHPMAAGQSGATTVFTRTNALSWGVPSPEAEVIAHVPGDPNKPVIISYQAGDQLLDGSSAPASRIALFPNSRGVRQMTPTGQAIVAAAITHALDEVPTPVNEAPAVDAGSDATIQLPVADVTLTGSATDDGLPAGSTLSVEWSQVDGPSGVVFADTASLSTTATMPGAGTFTLQLKASDSESMTTDTVVITVLEDDSPKDIVMIARNPNPPAGDRRIRDLLQEAGHNLTVIDDDEDLAAFDLTGVDLIMITPSVVTSKIRDVFNDTPIPVLTWEPFLFKDMALADEHQTSETYTQIVITNPGHPIAAGSNGTVTVYTEPNRLAWGTPSADAEVIAHVPGNADQPVIFAYTAGDVLIDGTIAPAARVGIFPDYNGARRLNEIGTAIFTAAVDLLLQP